MGRSTYIYIDNNALKHNLNRINQLAPCSKVIAMVKANAYGCRLEEVIPPLKGLVYGWGVACLKEALIVRSLDADGECILFQGLFSINELPTIVKNNIQCVLNHWDQIAWITEAPLSHTLKVWIKADTGMHRLGFNPVDVPDVLERLAACKWIEILGLMSHMGYADEPLNQKNYQQLNDFKQIIVPPTLQRSLANSAALYAFPESQFDAVRPGIMLYGVSPFADKTGKELGLVPAMNLYSTITAIFDCPANAGIGYSGIYITQRPTRVGVVAIGYGDGYPRTIEGGRVWINNQYVPIIGRVSMDMLTVDLTDFPDIIRGAKVELWGNNLPVEEIAALVNTTAYELLCKVTVRAYLTPLDC